jgi:hypothetical protein
VATCTNVYATNPTNGKTLGSLNVKIVSPFPKVNAVDWSHIKNEFPHLSHLQPPPPAANGACHLIIGNNNARLTGSLTPDTMGKGQPGLPIAKSTALGISIGGPTYPQPSNDVRCFLLQEASAAEATRLNQALSQARESSS